MATLIYTPGIQAHVKTARGIIDISDDLVSWQLNLRENAVHTFNFTLQNAQRKYDGLLLPMDQISVRLKRINWVQAFTGYLNDGPIFQAFPGTLDLTASCTLKVPQFWYWDPTTPETQTMVSTALQLGPEGTPPANYVAADSGLTQLIVDSLSKVCLWPKSRIHISEIPARWFAFAQKVGDRIEKDTAIYQTLGSNYVASGQASSLRVTLPSANYNGTFINPAQANNASIIYNTIRYTMKIADDSIAIMALMCSLQEASLLNRWSTGAAGSQNVLPNDGQGPSNYDSSGLFAQRLGGYGPIGKIMNPVSATEAFVTRLQSVIRGTPVAGSTDFGAAIQSVQVSANPGAYGLWTSAAQAMVATMNKLATAPAAASNPNFNGANIGSPAKSGSGSNIAKVAVDLIQAHKSNPIIYVLGNDDPDYLPVAQVKALDCSSLVDWVYYHGTGNHLAKGGGRNNVQSIFAQCVQIPVDLAGHIQGAVLGILPNDHIGISLGDGVNHVAAHQPYSDPTLDVNISPIAGNGFAAGGLLPGIDYTNSATTADAARQLQQILKLAKTPGLAPQLGSATDPSTTSTAGSTNPAFDALITALSFSADQSGLGLALGGAVTLINDQPFLPWLQNVINSSMRSFCSAPNGDFISWFPDYFGVWGTSAKMNIQQIELQNFDVRWSDQLLVTHQFVLGNPGIGLVDQASGGVGYSPDTPTALLNLAKNTAGIATMDFPEIFQAIYGESASTGYIQAFLQRFGARPDVQQMPYISKGKAEFFMALYLFIQRWANQFTANVPLTFMPELFPGMLLRIPDFGFQAYVRGVTHQGSFGQSGSFTTTVEVCAPSNIAGKNRTDLLGLLPQGGKVTL